MKTTTLGLGTHQVFHIFLGSVLQEGAASTPHAPMPCLALPRPVSSPRTPTPLWAQSRGQGCHTKPSELWEPRLHKEVRAKAEPLPMGEVQILEREGGGRMAAKGHAWAGCQAASLVGGVVIRHLFAQEEEGHSQVRGLRCITPGDELHPHPVYCESPTSTSQRVGLGDWCGEQSRSVPLKP